MSINTNEVLLWLKNFKYEWLSQNILDDPNLIELICNKICELEQLLIHDHPDENKTAEDQHVQVDDTDVIVISTTSSDIQTSIENETKKCEEFSRPAIRIKRIPLDEAEVYLPLAWRTPKSKRGQKKRRKNLSMRYSSRKRTKRNTQTPKSTPSPKKPQDETVIKSNDVRRSTRTKKLLRSPQSITDVASTRPKNDEKKKSKRKLRTMDGEDDDLYTLGNLSQTENFDVNDDCDKVPRFLGQNGILSQTRRANETTRDEDFTIHLHSRKGNQENNKSLNDTSMIETVPVDDDDDDDDDIVPLEDQQMLEQMLENHDNESLFTSLEITHDKTIGISSVSNNNSGLNYDDCIEDITNDGVDPPPPPSSSSPTIGNIPLTT